MIQNQLKMNKKKETEAALKDQQKPSKNYGFTRGKGYWEGKLNTADEIDLKCGETDRTKRKKRPADAEK